VLQRRGGGGVVHNLSALTVRSRPGEVSVPMQGRPLGGASGALAPGPDFEGAPKRRSPTGHTLIRSTVVVISSFANEKSRKGFFFNLAVLVVAYCDVFWCLHMYIHVMLYVYCCKYCLLPP
jgi:hypothetical protein